MEKEQSVKNRSSFKNFFRSSKKIEDTDTPSARMSITFKQKVKSSSSVSTLEEEKKGSYSASAPDDQLLIQPETIPAGQKRTETEFVPKGEVFDPLHEVTELRSNRQSGYESHTSGALDLQSQDSEVVKQIIFATQMTQAKSDYYLRGDPVSLIITNIPLFKGGRQNPWADADNQLISLRDAQGAAVKRKDLENTFQEQSYSDGLLEISVAKSMRHLITSYTRRLGQAAGPFEIKLSDEDTDESDRIHFV